MKHHIFVDIDGTCANDKERSDLAGPEPDRAHKDNYLEWLDAIQDHSRLLADKPYLSVLGWLHSTQKQRTIVYTTSREEIYRDVTLAWLRQHGFPQGPVLMRPSNCWLSSGALKEQMIHEYTKHLRLHPLDIAVIDDDRKGDIEEMCIRNGYDFFKATEGDIK